MYQINNQVNGQSPNLIIYQKYLEFIYYTTYLVMKYPKSERFTLAQETKQTLYEGLRYILFAQKEFSKTIRLKQLSDLDVSLNLLKVHIRIAYRYKYINSSNYSTWSLKVTDICNILGSWINSCLKR